MEEFAIDKPEVLKQNDLTDNYIDFRKIDKSFQGWLLTLDKSELGELVTEAHAIHHRNTGGPTDLDITDMTLSTLVFISKFDGIPPIGSKITDEEIIQKEREFVTSVILIGMVKEGLLTYSTSEDEGDWEFELTEAGKDKVEDLGLIN